MGLAGCRQRDMDKEQEEQRDKGQNDMANKMLDGVHCRQTPASVAFPTRK